MTPTAHRMSSPLIERLLDPQAYPHPVEGPTCVETHISWVLLTGAWAYKIKKPVAPGFLDFSTLALRHAACLDEVRLNRRFAPQLYVDVVPIAGPVERATVSGAGEPVEYAVRMRQFPQDQQLDRLLAAGQLGDADMASAAARIARFHDALPGVGAGSPHGTAREVRHSVEETLYALQTLVTDPGQRETLAALVTWCRGQFDALAPTFAARRESGRVRECHGDLHLGNLVRIGNDVVPFDCIEFSEELRCIDTISDVAFLMMDLLFHGQSALAYRLINDYLEACGDYAGVAVLRFYLVYRALVRALVALLRLGQLPEASAARDTAADAAAHLRLAWRLAQPSAPALLLMHGLSGSGKTRVSDRLMRDWPAIRVRSDVERKRLLGVHALEGTRSAPGDGAYTQAMSVATYERLGESVATILRAGFPAIVDAANLQRDARERFGAIARAQRAQCVIVSCAAPEPELRQRLRERAAGGGDASEADGHVLDLQLRHAEPLDASELAAALIVDTTTDEDASAHLRARLQPGPAG